MVLCMYMKSAFLVVEPAQKITQKPRNNRVETVIGDAEAN